MLEIESENRERMSVICLALLYLTSVYSLSLYILSWVTVAIISEVEQKMQIKSVEIQDSLSTHCVYLLYRKCFYFLDEVI